MTRAITAGLGLAFALGLAACSGGQRDSTTATETQLPGLERLVGGGRDAPPLVIVAPGAASAPLGAEIPARDARATLVRVGRNGAVTTWRSADAVGLSLRAPGVLVATRGLGEDLHIADAAATAAALAAGRDGAVPRSHDRLGGDQRLVRTRLDCTLTRTGRDTLTLEGTSRTADRHEEACTPEGGGPGFVNRYWRDPASGAVLASEQWIGPELGHVRLVHPAD
ncbi:YjbF family lipoprotein [Rhodobaculum claviforme]|nr:YjbF family lipoprotein [Rhodobaculum claviforme]